MTFINDISYILPKKAILKRLNRKGGKFTSNFDKIWKDMEVLLYEISAPVAIYDDLKILNMSDKKEINIEKIGIIKSKILHRLLIDTSCVYILACTLGNRLEAKIRELSDNDRLSEAVLLDAMASEVIDVVCYTINIMIKNLSNANRRHITRRVSPGYGDIPLFLNKKIITILGEDKLGIKVLDTGLMHPQKSITAIIGVY